MLTQLRSLGVEVILGDGVAEADGERVRLASGRVIPTRTLIWSAGVKGSPLAEMLGVPLRPDGRVPVRPTLEVRGLQRVYVVGDMAYLEGPDGQPYPMLIPVAKQQGILAAHNILRRARGQAQQPFRYRDRGLMATIGRRRAVAWIYNRVPLRGYLAWVAWLGLHLLWLIGFRNRLNVLVNWVWNYFVYPLPGAYGSRTILFAEERRPQERVPQHPDEDGSADGCLPISESEVPGLSPVE